MKSIPSDVHNRSGFNSAWKAGRHSLSTPSVKYRYKGMSLGTVHDRIGVQKNKESKGYTGRRDEEFFAAPHSFF